MRLQYLLQGKTSQAQQALDTFFSSISEERILWYPSAGCDYRDVMEVTEDRLALHQIPEQPNIICHTDYHPDWTKLIRKNTDQPLLMRKDARTTINIIEQHPLVLTVGTEYFIDNQPTVYLLKLKIDSDTLGVTYAYVFYFMLENYLFLEELILKQQLAITHFVKVRQGCGCGGCRKCISVFYSLLANIGVKYLLVDAEVHYCFKTHHKLALRNNISHQNYQLQRIGIPLRWSDYHVRAFHVIPQPGKLNNDSFNASLAAINRGWGGAFSDPWESKIFFPIQRNSQILNRDFVLDCLD